MSLPGVESARRRRASHGRSSVGFVQPPPLRRRSCPHPPATSASFNPPRRILDPAGQYREILNERALAARHRLDERLRDPAACTPHSINRRHDASSISGPMVVQPRANEKPHSRNGLRVMNEEKLVPESHMDGLQDDCPVCLDSFLPGQTVVHLPCRHTFHSACIVPWLQNHCHCPSCRAKIPLSCRITPLES